MKLLSLTLVSLIALGFKEVSGIRSRDYESHEQQLDPQAPVTPAQPATPATPATPANSKGQQSATGMISKFGVGNLASQEFEKCCQKAGGYSCGSVLKQCCISQNQCTGYLVKSCADEKQIRVCDDSVRGKGQDVPVKKVQNFQTCCANQNGQSCGKVFKQCCQKSKCEGWFVKTCDDQYQYHVCNNAPQ